MKKQKKSDLKFIFVHGLSGWGSYDTVNRFFPYWGLSGGSVIRHLRKLGYDCYAASVSPTASAWDRACELYAQLTGSRVDYGKEHSERCHHERFGRDFSQKPLIDSFETSRLVLIGHSFGGATIRLFHEILIHGSREEQDATDAKELSPYFRGGDRGRIHSVITLAAPTNGTTSYDMHEDPDYHTEEFAIPEKYLKAGSLMSKGTKAKTDGRAPFDYASYDMHIDNAQALNARITTFSDIYYIAYPCSTSIRRKNGRIEPNAKITESMFMKSAILMSNYQGKTKGGMTVDQSWQSNDGLVNEISAKAPFNAPSISYEKGMKMKSGIWYVMPTITGDHMYLQGGMTKRVKIKPFYEELCQMVTELD